jgi:hypothetical protein
VGIIAAASRFHSMRPASSSDSELILQTAIPFDTPIKVSINGGPLSLNDERGSAVSAAGASVQVQHATGRANPDLVFTVTGKRN